MKYFFVFFVACVHAFSSFEELEVELDLIPRDSLVIFNIDDLICPQDFVLWPCSAPFRTQWFCNQAEFQLSFDDIDWLMGCAWERARFVCCDEILHRCFRKCAKRGIKVIGFSECGMERLVFERLRGWNLSFSPFLGCVFPQLGWFNQGVLFCGNFLRPSHCCPYAPRQRAELLRLCLDQIPCKFRHVYCFFSCRDTLCAIEKILKPRGICFKGFLCQRPVCELNEEVAAFQLQTLCRHQRWIGDCEALKFLER
jgi:hypothetical protein